MVTETITGFSCIDRINGTSFDDTFTINLASGTFSGHILGEATADTITFTARSGDDDISLNGRALPLHRIAAVAAR